MAARAHRADDGRWLVCCAECGLLPAGGEAVDYETAEHAVALHNSDMHLAVSRPEWAEVEHWAQQHRAAVQPAAAGA